MRVRRIILISSLVFSIVFAFGFFVYNSDIYFEINKNIELFGKIYKEISFNYVDEVDPQEFMRSGIKGMLKNLDPYTVFIDEERQDDIDLITNGKYGGVGITIGVRNDKVTILETLEGYSAQKQGVRIGDVITRVGDNEIAPENIDDISTLVKGEPGTQVKISIVRYNEKDTLVFNLIREEIIVKNLAFADFYPENSNNVYLKLTNFSRSASDELRNALRELKSKKEIKSIVLDLRGNPGGLLDIAVDICDKFLNKELLIVTTIGRDLKSEKKYFAEEEPLAGKEKIAILINSGSASASEIVAGAIQDHDRGVLVGTQSFGKGLVQTIIPLSFNTSLKITTARYYTPSGRCIQKIDYSKDNEVVPDHQSPQSVAYNTDNKRIVFSKGGIAPDSTVHYEIESDIVKDLLAKGLFFSFADKYFYKNENFDFAKIKDEKILADFKEFLKETDYDYQSDVEKKLDEVILHLKSNHDGDKLNPTIEKLKTQISEMFDDEFKKNGAEITTEVKVELAHRLYGNNGGIRERMKSDKQFTTALNILNNENVYSRLLNSK